MDDTQLEYLWREFGNIPIDEATDQLIYPFMHFDVGDDRMDVWAFFDHKHSKGVAYLCGLIQCLSM